MEIFYKILSYLFSTLLGGGLIFYLFKTYFSEKIKQSIKNDYDVKIEKLKGEISQNYSLINSILSTQNQNNLAVQNERINAIKVLWENYLLIKSELAIFIYFEHKENEKEIELLFSHLLKNELINKNFFNLLNTILNTDKFNKSNEHFTKIKNNIPFLNEKIIKYIEILNNFYIRLYLFYSTTINNVIFLKWEDDKLLNQILQESLEDAEYNYLMSLSNNKIMTYVNIIEKKILFEINKIIEGKIIFHNNIDNIKLLNNISNLSEIINLNKIIDNQSDICNKSKH